MYDNQTEMWRVTSISNAYSAVCATGPRDILMATLAREGFALSCVIGAESDKPEIRRYRGASLGDGYYKLVLPEPERCAILVAFCSYMAFDWSTTFDRSWIESGESELWRLVLEHPFGCIGITIHLALRG